MGSLLEKPPQYTWKCNHGTQRHKRNFSPTFGTLIKICYLLLDAGCTLRTRNQQPMLKGEVRICPYPLHVQAIFYCIIGLDARKKVTDGDFVYCGQIKGQSRSSMAGC
jgi:hypothetical protein